MSQALSNLSLFLPLSSSRRITYSPRPQSFPVVKARAGEPRDNLDHLQRATKPHPPQAPPKKRVAPAAPVGLWDRFPTARTVQQMIETMDRMMEDPLEYSSGWSSPLPNEATPYKRGRTPWEIKEGETEYKMRFDMPGMTKEDVQVWVEEKMLVVKAEKEPKKKKENGVINGEGDEEEWSAKSYGKYSCRIALPENIQFEKIRAEVKDGVLYITIPKATVSSKIFDINVQ
ncbi:small heat shock protein, chloroplastic-like [Humulus lupulus]|uniref:small heat shock protein, chloroplastic-like n=1 Tax=Humulus lupulus TaxID=3486 RepID=UPI002B4179EE|nr:small heat shock protein, chloroplastic-like [Humulus lupulus]